MRVVEENSALGKAVFPVTPSKTSGAIVGRELSECGYTVTRFSNAWEALQFSASTKSDMVVTVAIMVTMDGINLASALAIMKCTEDIPVVVITSLDTGGRDLERLPDGVAVIRHGEHFSDELVEALSAFENGDLKQAVSG